MTLPGLVAANNLSDVADKERAWDNLGVQFDASFETAPLALGIGTPTGGGYFAGYISHTANGIPTHALIVAPRATGATGTGYSITSNRAWSPSYATTAGLGSLFDGAANTAAMAAHNINLYPAAQFCTTLSIGGYTDWYLPSLYELDIAYYNLKPSTTANSTSSGANPYSVPRRDSNNSASVPARTLYSPFNGAESFTENIHWTSSEFSSIFAWNINFANGSRGSTSQYKEDQRAVRAFRRIAL